MAAKKKPMKKVPTKDDGSSDKAEYIRQTPAAMKAHANWYNRASSNFYFNQNEKRQMLIKGRANQKTVKAAKAAKLAPTTGDKAEEARMNRRGVAVGRERAARTAANNAAANQVRRSQVRREQAMFKASGMTFSSFGPVYFEAEKAMQGKPYSRMDGNVDAAVRAARRANNDLGAERAETRRRVKNKKKGK